MKKYMLMTLMLISFMAIQTAVDNEPSEVTAKASKNKKNKKKKKSRSSQRNVYKKCCPAGGAQVDVGFGYYAYPQYYSQVGYWGAYWGGPYYYPQYPAYRSIGFGVAWGAY